MSVRVPLGAKRHTQSLKVLRADGSVKEDRGVVNYWHVNPLRRFGWWLIKWSPKIRNFFVKE